MQTTESLILEYGRTQVGTAQAGRCRKRIQSRSRKGDKLAHAFLHHDFTFSASRYGERSVKNIRRVLIKWLRAKKPTGEDERE